MSLVAVGGKRTLRSTPDNRAIRGSANKIMTNYIYTMLKGTPKKLSDLI
jgi:hypothetical protein